MRILEAERIGNLAHALRRAEQAVFRDVDDFALNILLRRASRFALDQIAEVARRETDLVGKVFDRRQSVLYNHIRVGKIAVEQLLEAGESVVIDLDAGAELAVVETQAVVEDYLYMGAEQIAAVLIDGMIEFVLDFFQTVEEYLTLLLREVQSLVLRVVEKGVATDFLPESRTRDEVGVEEQTVAFGLHIGRTLFDFDILTRSETYDCTLLIVVILATIANRTTYAIFEKQRVKTIVDAHMLVGVFSLGEINHRNERVLGREAIELVVGIDAVELYDFVHSSIAFYLFRYKIIFLFRQKTHRSAQSAIMVIFPKIHIHTDHKKPNNFAVRNIKNCVIMDSKVILNNGVEMPLVGYGVFQVSPAECERCVSDALSVGYRSIDTAQAYMNEEGVGNAWRKSGLRRDELFLTTKGWVSNSGEERAARSIDESLRKLQTDYIDLLLIHQAFGDYYGTYRAMEKALRDGKVRAIGVSNFYHERFLDIAEYMDVKPAVNQIETNVFQQQTDMEAVMKPYGTRIMAWGPLAEGANGFFTNPLLSEIAAKYNKSVAQVALHYLAQRGVIVIPKSTHKERMEQNRDIFDFELSADDMAAIRSLDLGRGAVVDFTNAQVRMGLFDIIKGIKL